MIYFLADSVISIILNVSAVAYLTTKILHPQSETLVIVDWILLTVNSIFLFFNILGLKVFRKSYLELKTNEAEFGISKFQDGRHVGKAPVENDYQEGRKQKISAVKAVGDNEVVDYSEVGPGESK